MSLGLSYIDPLDLLQRREEEALDEIDKYKRMLKQARKDRDAARNAIRYKSDPEKYRKAQADWKARNKAVQAAKAVLEELDPDNSILDSDSFISVPETPLWSDTEQETSRADSVMSSRSSVSVARRIAPTMAKGKAKTIRYMT
jgi:small-conductance mechanosensitive channel